MQPIGQLQQTVPFIYHMLYLTTPHKAQPTPIRPRPLTIVLRINLEPSRKVSAYFYCQKPERFPDPLCANYVRRVDTMDLVTFAKHWTNFGLRQYVTSFILPEDITSSPLVANMGPNVPGWYKVRAVLDAKVASNIDDPLVDIAMYR